MKKILNLILASVISVTALSVTACNKGNGGSPETSSEPVAVVERLEMEKSSVIIALGDKTELLVSYNPLENGVLTWTSSAPNVVSVDENGYVEGLSVGSAIVTASYGTKTVSCAVEVSLAGNVPTLVFDGDVHENVTLTKGDSFGLGARVLFNGKEFDDAEIQYYVSDETIGTVVDGAFVAGTKAGSTQISVLATWRGQTVRQKTITVNVVAESTVLLNGGRLKNIKLYTASEHEGETYATSQMISEVRISEDGVPVQEYTLSVLDEKIARIEKKDDGWEVQAVKSGKTTLLVKYADKEFPFEIAVERPVFALENCVEYSVLDGKYWDADKAALKDLSEMFSGFGTLVSYEIGGKEYKAKDGKVELNEGKNIALVLYNENVGYKLQIDAYTMLIDELQDFEYIYAGDVKTYVSGSYVLMKDIIETETVLTMPTGKVPNNFAGTFDGRGHVLSFTFVHGTEHRFGLFGEFLKGATIKNVALDNITMDGTTGKNAAGIICGNGAENGETSPESTIENVYVNLTFSEKRTDNLVFMGNAMWKTIMKNVIIDVPGFVAGENSYGSFARGNAASVSNCYIISPTPTYYPQPEPTPENKNAGPFTVVPVRYDSYAEMELARNDYSSFSGEFWDTSSGVPVWKSLAEKDA